MSMLIFLLFVILIGITAILTLHFLFGVSFYAMGQFVFENLRNLWEFFQTLSQTEILLFSTLGALIIIWIFYRIFRTKPRKIGTTSWGTLRPIVYFDHKNDAFVSIGIFGRYIASVVNMKKFYHELGVKPKNISDENLLMLMLSRILEITEKTVPALQFSADEINENSDTIAETIANNLTRKLEKIGILLENFSIDGIYGTHQKLDIFSKSQNFLIRKEDIIDTDKNQETPKDEKKSIKNQKEIMKIDEENPEEKEEESITPTEYFSIENAENRLKTLATLKKSHLINEKEYETKKSRILESI